MVIHLNSGYLLMYSNLSRVCAQYTLNINYPKYCPCIFCVYEIWYINNTFNKLKEEKSILKNDCISYIYFSSLAVNWIYSHTYLNIYLILFETYYSQAFHGNLNNLDWQNLHMFNKMISSVNSICRGKLKLM